MKTGRRRRNTDDSDDSSNDEPGLGEDNQISRRKRQEEAAREAGARERHWGEILERSFSNRSLDKKEAEDDERSSNCNGEVVIVSRH